MICKVKSFLQVTEYTPHPPIDISISFINLSDAISVEMLGLKPYCSSTSMSLLREHKRLLVEVIIEVAG